MAALSQVIELIFEGIDNASEVADRISTGLGDMGKQAKAARATLLDFATPFSGLADKILLIDAAIAALATALGVKAVGAASQFTSSLTDLNRFLKEGEGTAKDYTDQFAALSTKYGININDIVQSTADWSAANFNIKDSLELTRLAMDYATAGQIDAAQATDVLKRLLAGMSVDADDATESAKRFGDVINFIADISTGGFDQLAEALAILSPQINTSGASFEQFAAIVSSSVDLLQSGAQAGDGLKTIMGQLTQPTKDAQVALAQFGVTVDSAGITQGSFYNTLSKIAAKWPELTASEKNHAVNLLVSAERAAQLQNILNGWPTIMDRASKAVSAASDSMANEVGRALDTSEKAFASFQQSVNNLFIAVGTKLEPATVGVTKSLQKVATAFEEVVKSGGLDPLFDAFADVGKRLGGQLEVIAGNLPEAFEGLDFSGILGAFDNLGEEIGNFFDALTGGADLSTVEGLRAAIEGILDSGAALINTTAGIVRAFEPFAAAAHEAGLAFRELGDESAIDFGEFIGSTRSIVALGPEVAGSIIGIGKAGIEMGSAINTSFGAIKVVINTLQIAFDSVVLGLLKTREAFLEAGLAFAEFGNKVALTDFAKAESQRDIDSFNASLGELRYTIAGVTENLERNKMEFGDGMAQIDGSSVVLNGLTERLNRSKESLDNFGKAGPAAAQELQALEDIKLPTFDVTEPEKNINSLLEKAKELGQIKWSNLEEGPNLADGFKRDADAATGLVPKLVTVRDEWGNIVRTYTEWVPAGQKVSGQLSVIGESLDKTKKSTEEATKKSDEFLAKMEQIASNERIKLIESTVKLNVAQIEADVKRVEAAFKSVDNTVSSTGDTITSLFGTLVGTENAWKELKIEDQIREENKRREEALELQKKLVETEIDRIKAQTERLERGDAIITVKADGLKPQLEAFMWEILKAIQVRASASMQEFLLGIA